MSSINRRRYVDRNATQRKWYQENKRQAEIHLANGETITKFIICACPDPGTTLRISHKKARIIIICEGSNFWREKDE